ncbi:hypothetical protein CDL15_Pgr017239 [Punica granatum]|uniref:Uncharacterized protein n=1 Tax=Punica granatum TaxID=22663 RepID=A0A218WR57_PUNGR|nr:hypothetical protein CDL15_Pgr017239 [Punica granatum]
MAAAAVRGKRVSTRAPATARCEIGLVGGRYGLRDPRDGSRGSSGKTGRHASSGDDTVRDRARWTPQRRI